MSNKYPECWTTSEVCIWLKDKGFGMYVDSFRRHKIDGEALLMLTEKDLKEDLQVDVLGDVKRLLAAITRLTRPGLPGHPDLHNNVPLAASSTSPHNNHQHKHLTHSSGSSHNRSRNYSSDSQASDLPDQSRLGNIRRSSGVATQLKPEYLRTAISFLYVLLVTLITAFVMVFVHDRVPDKDKHPPLPDIFLDNVPHISWAFQLCEITIITLSSVWFSILFFHKHRSIACRRFCALSGSVLLLRCATMFITSLSVPGSHLECAPRVQSDIWTKMSQAYVIWRGGGLSLMGVRTCGDYMFSGHTATLTLLNFFITEYTPRRVYYLHIFSWVLNMFGIFFILAAHEHYSIDVFIAFYITSRMFLYYHSLANNRALQQRDSFRTKIWFPMFSYFEAHIDGIVPNEYSNPLAAGKLLKVVKNLFLMSNFLFKKENSLFKKEKSN